MLLCLHFLRESGVNSALCIDFQRHILPGHHYFKKAGK